MFSLFGTIRYKRRELSVKEVMLVTLTAASVADEKTHFSKRELVFQDRTASSMRTVPRDIVMS